MIDPITGIAIGSTVVGALGSLFGSGTSSDIPPEFMEVFNLLKKQAQEGFGQGALQGMQQQLNQQLGNEFGALGALTEQRIARQGGGAGVQNAALSRLDSSRLNAKSTGMAQLSIANEQAKFGALGALGQLAPQFANFQQDRGQGYANLFGAGLNMLMRGQGNKQAIDPSVLMGARSAFYTPVGQFGNRPGGF